MAARIILGSAFKFSVISVLNQPFCSLLQPFDDMIGFQPGTRMETGSPPMSLAAVKNSYGREVRQQRITRR